MNRTSTLLLALLVATSAHALDPSRALTQARISVWTSESGLPQNTIDAIVQTRDGYLWIGTEEGLVRFDGVRFVVRDCQNTPALRSAFVSSLFEAPDRTLWIGTYGGGLARLRNGRIEAFRADLLGNDRLREMHVTADGAMFIATAGGGLLRIDGERVTRFTTKDGLPTDRIWALEDDGAGGMWVATHGGGVVRWQGGGVTQRIEGLPNELARALLRDPDGTLWIGTDGGGVVVWRNGAIERVITTNDGLPSNLVRSLQRDRAGSLWIGTDGGVARWRGVKAEPFLVADGLPSPVVRTVIEDREGSLWVGTTGGLVRMNDTRFLSFTQKEGLPVGGMRAMLEDGSGRIWAGTEGGGLCEIAANGVRCLTTADGLPHDTVFALARARDGGLWIGTDGGGVVRLRDGKLVDRITDLPNSRVRALVETADGLWISTTAGLVRIRDGQPTRVKELDGRQLRPLLALPDGTLLVGTDGAGLWRVRDGHAAQIASAGRGLESDRIFSLAADAAGGGVWIGTSGGGLARLDLAGGSAQSLMRRDGLYDDVIFQVVDDGTHLWMTSNRGLYRVGREPVLAAMRGRAADLSGNVYGTTDGMPSAETNAAFPAAVRAGDGRLWVGTARGVAVVDPRATGRNTVAPPVHVEEVLIDGNPVPAGPLRVPPRAQRLEIRYSALSFRAPERVRFRYLLEGYDRDWVDAGASRVAHYTKLAPGSYTFRVAATNEDGVRSEGAATLAVTVLPRWFETWWARLLGFLLIAAAVWAAMRLRLAALRARKNEELAGMARELEDTNRQLAVANVRLRALSYVDGLTGVANRRRFDEALDEACAQGEPLSLILIDLDHFKKLNDTHGHHEGDEALRAVASLLDERTDSRGGLAARFGGEEFAWLLPGVSLDDARAEAEELRRIVREAGIRHDGAASGIVTASIGVAASDGTLTPLALVAAADAALYRAKSGGRDKVEVDMRRLAVLTLLLLTALSCTTTTKPRGKFGQADPFAIGAQCIRPVYMPPSDPGLCWVIEQGTAGWPKDWDAIEVTFQNLKGPPGGISLNTGILCLGQSYSLAPNGGTATAVFYHKQEICLPNEGDLESLIQVTSIKQAYGPEFQAGAKCVMQPGSGTTRHCWTAERGKSPGWPESAKSVKVTYSNPGTTDISITSSFACGIGPATVPAKGTLEMIYHHKNVVCLNPNGGGQWTELDIISIDPQ